MFPFTLAGSFITGKIHVLKVGTLPLALLSWQVYGEGTEAQRHRELAKFTYRQGGGSGFEHVVLENHSPRLTQESNPPSKAQGSLSVSTTGLHWDLPPAPRCRREGALPASLSLSLGLPTTLTLTGLPSTDFKVE